ALRVSQQAAEIQAALHKHGYRTRKQPKQAAWKIFPVHSPPKTKTFPDSPPCTSGVRGVTGKYFLLSYQTHPIPAWVLSPQDDNPVRRTIWNIIQRTVQKSSL
ncbi:MAG TPA: hypothetical protein V6D33_16055, partial [Cyanophyceae cyanobacterium]